MTHAHTRSDGVDFLLSLLGLESGLADPLAIAALVVAGIAAGFLNVIAGGGSMLTLPALMLLGLPADLANGSNRVAIVSQCLAGLAGYAQKGHLDRRALAPMLAPTVLGAALGAWLAAAWVPRALLKPILLGTMVSMALLMALRPRLLAPEPGDPLTLRGRPLAAVALFGAGLYGGFVQAGVGFVLIAVLGGMLRHDLVRANALKLAAVLVFGAVALVVFVLEGQVVWGPALLLAVATVIGARLGVRFAVEVRTPVLRRIVLATVLAACVAAWLKP